MESRLNVILAKKKMTKKQLGDLTGYGRTTLWKISTDKGIENTNMQKLKRIAEALNCQIKDLFVE